MFLTCAIGIPEILLFFTAQHDALADTHYVYDNVTGAATWEAVPHCMLVPPQPFWLQVDANMGKVFLLLVALGVAAKDSYDHKVPVWKKCLYYAVTFYQFVMVPVSMGASIYHFSTMGPFDSTWQAYECFGAMWTTGPWWFNAMMFAPKMIMQQQHSSLGSPPDMKSARGVARWGSENLLVGDDPTVKTIEQSKAVSFTVLWALTSVPYLVIWSPFVFTHVIPGAVLYFPATLLIGGLAALWTNKMVGSPDDEALTSGLFCMPGLILASIACENAYLCAMYYYEPDSSYMSVIETVWLERRFRVYANNFYIKVFSQFYASADIANEVL